MNDSVRKDLKEMNVDSMIIPVGCTKYIQAPYVCWNKPFKVRMTELYDQWLSEGAHQFTEGGNMKPPPRKRLIECVLDTWSQLSKENINCLSVADDGIEDDFIHWTALGKRDSLAKLEGKS